jgi:uncharacterized protein
MNEQSSSFSAISRAGSLFGLLGRLASYWLILVGIIIGYIGVGTLAVAQKMDILILLDMVVIYPFTVIGVTYLYRRFVDKRPWNKIGLLSPIKGFSSFLRGCLYALLMTVITFGIFLAFGWVHFDSFHFTADFVFGIILGTVITFFSEPLLEETAFRGYIYHNFNSYFPRWAALLGQVILFALWPLAGFFIVVFLHIEPSSSLPNFAVYIPQLLLFGIILQLCQIRAGNLWMSIGYHLTYLQVFKIMGTGKGTFIQLTSGLPTFEIQGIPLHVDDVMMLGMLLLSSLLFIGWQRIRNYPMKWKVIYS